MHSIRRARIARILYFALVLIYAALIVFDLKQFTIWSQVNSIACYWAISSSACDAIAAEFRNDAARDLLLIYGANFPELVLHAIRSFAFIPIFIVSNITGYTPDSIFSIVVGVLTVAISRYLSKSVWFGLGTVQRNTVEHDFTNLIMFFILGSLSLAMNGRLLFAWASMVVLLYYWESSLKDRVATKDRVAAFHKFALPFLALFLSFSTSMATVIATAGIGIILVRHGYSNGKLANKGFLLLVILPFAPILPAFKLYVQNHGSVSETLGMVMEHGSGRLLLSLPTFCYVAAGAIIMACTCCCMWKFIIGRDDNFAKSMALICITMGFFGYAAYALAIIPILKLLMMQAISLTTQSAVIEDN